MLLRGPAPRRLVVGILGIQAIAIVIFSAVNHHWSGRAVTSQMEGILDLAAKDATADVDAYVAAMEGAADQVIAAVRQADADTEQTEQSLFHALAYVPHLSGAYVGDSSGAFLYVRTDGPGYVTKTIAPGTQGAARTVTLVERDSELLVTATTADPDDEYDPRERPWFRDALAADGAPIWTSPYIFFTSREPGMTRAVRIDHGGSDVVAGVDFELSAVVGLLDQLSTHIAGEVTITTPGDLLLTRHGVFRVDAIPETYRALVRPGEEQNITELAEGRVRYELDGATHVRHRTEVGPVDAPWVLTLDLTESTVVSPMLRVFARQRWLAVVIGGLAVLSMAMVIRSPIQRLELESTTDALTSLPNRREILRMGASLAEHADGYFVAMIDIDHFKRVNDRFGHPVGDEVLQAVAARLMNREFQVGRLGGEEFIMLFPPSSPVAVDTTLAQLRADVADTPIETSASPVTVTVSIGVHRHEPGTAFSAVLAGADSALLEAKATGRDRVVRFADIDTLRLTADGASAASVRAG